MNIHRQDMVVADDMSNANNAVVSSSVTTAAPVTTTDTHAATAAAATLAAATAAAVDERRRVQRREQRTAVLTHETSEKRNATRLRLHITRTKRELETQKAQLTSWDPVAYQKQAQLEKQKAQEQAAAENNGELLLRKKRGRKGPESWKLKGAARPAWQVYDFDTRYVCPHIAAHEEHQEKTKRSFNLLALCRKQQEQPHFKPPALFLNNNNSDSGDNNDQENDLLLYVCRDYLALLMELGHLYLQAKQFKSARETWLQCLELDYGGISTAGDELMRMYLDLRRYEAAFRLGQRLLVGNTHHQNDEDDKSSNSNSKENSSSSSSVWIQYSTALVAWHLKHEMAPEYLEQAIRFNPFCAYYLAFWNTFDGVMEYTHELDAMQQQEDEDAPPQSSLEEAIEYCSSNDNQQANRWITMGGHVALSDVLLQTIQKKHPSLTRADVDWNARLVKLEQFCQEQEEEAAAAANQQQAEDEKKKTDSSSSEAATEKNEHQVDTEASSSSNDDDNEEENISTSGSNEIMPPTVDLAMFVGMFRTAMEMVQEEDPRFAMVV